MTARMSATERAAAIATAIDRFAQGTTVGDHDGRLIAVNLGIEAGFGGTDTSRRQQVQHYLAKFPQLRGRWRQAIDDTTTRQPPKQTDLRAELATQRRRSARLEQQVDAMVRVADLWRRKAQRLERQLEQQRRRQDPNPPDDGVVVPLHAQD